MKRNQASKSKRRKASDGVCEVDQVDCAKVLDARSALPTEKTVQEAADAFRVLANPNRLRALKALKGRELCVCDVQQVLGISMSGTSQVLRELRNLGAVEFRAEGKLAYYRIADRSWLKVAESVLAKLASGGELTEASPHSSGNGENQ